MKTIAKEIYNNLVNAKIGEAISTRGQNKMDYYYTILDMLKQQGYKKGVHYTDNYISPIIKLKDIKPYEEPKHNIKLGDIFYNSWGYDQTNIDFYQVVKVSDKTVWIREIESKSVEYNAYQMTGEKVAVKDAFCSDEILKKTPYFFSGEWRINFEFGAGGLWDGKSMNYSCYA